MLGPPAATMFVGGVRYLGEIGSYTLPDRGDDAPWRTADTLEETVLVSASDRLVVSLAGVAIGSWQAVYAPARVALPNARTLLAGSGDPGGSGGSAGSASIEVPAPPPGDWVVMIELAYPPGGSGAYYWHLTVTP